MKRIIKLLIYMMVFVCFSYVLVIDKNSDEKHEHAHIFSVSEIYAYDFGDCPVCGRPLIGTVTNEPSCTEGAYYTVICSSVTCSYEDRGNIPALGHDYKPHVITEQTCTQSGLTRYECSRCDEYYEETNEALGHNYLYKVTKEATCTEEGIRTYTCTRCNNSYTKSVPALGHDVEYEEVVATCISDGYKKGICKRCNEHTLKVFPASGHSFGEFKVIKEASCTEDGSKEAICSMCGESIKENIPASGHKYPDEWTVEKEADFLNEGLQSKTCSVCGEKIYLNIPKKDPTALIIGVVAAVAVLVGGVFAYINAKRKKSFRKVKDDVVDKDLLKPEFENRTILVNSSNEELILSLKGKEFLAVKTCEFDELVESTKEEEPDLIIVEINSNKRYKAIMKLKEEELNEIALGLILDKKIFEKKKNELDKLKEDKKLIGFVTKDTEVNIMQVKLVLPVLKPKLNSDESIANIGMVADALGIPYVSKVLDLYVTGRDLKSALEEEEKGISETATIIGDIATILGLDRVASVAGLVGDAEAIRDAFDSESGVHEKSAGISGAKDVVEVVSDIVNKK